MSADYRQPTGESALRLGLTSIRALWTIDIPGFERGLQFLLLRSIVFPRFEASVRMKAPSFFFPASKKALAIALYVASTGCLGAFDFGGENDVTAVAAKKSDAYVRTQLPDGGLKPETYAFANGGLWSGSQKDASIDKLTFLDVAHTIAYPLASQAYIPAKDPATTSLLIVVYWGGTVPQGQANTSPEYANLQDAANSLSALQSATHSALSGGSAASQGAINEVQGQLDAGLAMVAAENQLRDKADYQIARMLGYDDWWNATAPTYFVNPIREHRFEDVVSEVEDGRYFVVLMAYDFQQLRTKKKATLLWETRFSIRERQHQFDRDLAGMAQSAAQYFGQNTHGLVRDRLPAGHVEIGPVKSLGPVQDPSPTAAPAQPLPPAGR